MLLRQNICAWGVVGRDAAVHRVEVSAVLPRARYAKCTSNHGELDASRRSPGEKRPAEHADLVSSLYHACAPLSYCVGSKSGRDLGICWAEKAECCDDKASILATLYQRMGQGLCMMRAELVRAVCAVCAVGLSEAD